MLTDFFESDILLTVSAKHIAIDSNDGRLAQLVRAPALQAGGHRFESYIAHHWLCRNSSIGRATDL